MNKRKLAYEAAQWVILCRDESRIDEEQLAKLIRWLSRSKWHVAAFREAARVHERVGRLQLAAPTSASSQKVISLWARADRSTPNSNFAVSVSEGLKQPFLMTRRRLLAGVASCLTAAATLEFVSRHTEGCDREWSRAAGAASRWSHARRSAEARTCDPSCPRNRSYCGSGARSLRRRFRQRRLDCIRRALQVIEDGDRDGVDAAAAQVVEEFSPELGAFGLFDPDGSTSRVPSRNTPSARYSALFCTIVSSRIFTRSASKNTTGYIGSRGPV